MTLKNKTGLIISIIIILTVVFITIRLSGHKESLGILIIGLFFMDLVALFIGALLSIFKIFTKKVLLVFIRVIVATFLAFIEYHRSYDSYRETRSVFWGLNR